MLDELLLKFGLQDANSVTTTSIIEKFLVDRGVAVMVISLHASGHCICGAPSLFVGACTYEQ